MRDFGRSHPFKYSLYRVSSCRGSLERRPDLNSPKGRDGILDQALRPNGQLSKHGLIPYYEITFHRKLVKTIFKHLTYGVPYSGQHKNIPISIIACLKSKKDHRPLRDGGLAMFNFIAEIALIVLFLTAKHSYPLLRWLRFALVHFVRAYMFTIINSERLFL